MNQILQALHGLNMHRNEAIKYVEELDAKGLLEKLSSGTGLFYSGRHHSLEKPNMKEIT